MPRIARITTNFNPLNLWQKITAKINRKELAKICAIRGKNTYRLKIILILLIYGKKSQQNSQQKLTAKN
ncbi:hypothetical protein B0A64_01125 [Flavobacterium araucananum]|uniref:Uncharacterized protein n=1 Tax=Flavobacterium araucananum TaxID=946678 RepID=A0A227PJ23_9FLAO|nr:hypothetical protein B0A64_01125 [Flavobacterium araucananum]